jgi:hypothetical protein
VAAHLEVGLKSSKTSIADVCAICRSQSAVNIGDASACNESRTKYVHLPRKLSK